MSKIKFPSSILLVEGPDDQHVVWTLLQHHKIEENFSVLEKGGIEDLLKTVPVQLKGSELRQLGIMVDADENIAGRWQSLTDILRKAGYSGLPARPDDAGTIIDQEGKPRLGIWLMPDNRATGMVEDFIRFLVPVDDALIGHARHCVQNIDDSNRRFRPSYLSKAEIHTWLAWQEHPGTPLGQAITKKYLDAHCHHATSFMAWIRRLFGDHGAGDAQGGFAPLNPHQERDAPGPA
jgi:hypothetical protein